MSTQTLAAGGGGGGGGAGGHGGNAGNGTGAGNLGGRGDEGGHGLSSQTSVRAVVVAAAPPTSTPPRGAMPTASRVARAPKASPAMEETAATLARAAQEVLTLLTPPRKPSVALVTTPPRNNRT